MLARRDFLFLCASTAVTLGTGQRPAGAQPFGETGRVGPDRDGFLALLNEPFRVFDQAGGVAYAELLAVEDGPAAEGLEQFSLVFRGDHADFLEAELYGFHHPRLGGFFAYMDPTRDDEVGRRYVVHFSRFTDPETP